MTANLTRILIGGLIALVGEPVMRVYEWLVEDVPCAWANETAGPDE